MLKCNRYDSHFTEMTSRETSQGNSNVLFLAALSAKLSYTCENCCRRERIWERARRFAFILTCSIPITSLRVAGDFCLAFPDAAGYTYSRQSRGELPRVRVAFPRAVPFLYDNQDKLVDATWDKSGESVRIHHGSADVFEITARGELKNCSVSTFSPSIVPAFLRVRRFFSCLRSSGLKTVLTNSQFFGDLMRASAENFYLFNLLVPSSLNFLKWKMTVFLLKQ